MSADRGSSAAYISYDLTTLTAEGEKTVSGSSTDAFAAELSKWENAIKTHDAKIHDWLVSRNRNKRDVSIPEIIASGATLPHV